MFVGSASSSRLRTCHPCFFRFRALSRLSALACQRFAFQDTAVCATGATVCSKNAFLLPKLEGRFSQSDRPHGPWAAASPLPSVAKPSSADGLPAHVLYGASTAASTGSPAEVATNGPRIDLNSSLRSVCVFWGGSPGQRLLARYRPASLPSRWFLEKSRPE